MRFDRRNSSGQERKSLYVRIEAYTWVPVLGVFDKLREVSDLFYLGFTLYLSVL